MKILFPDNWHFHRRNFKPLFSTLESKDVQHIFEVSRKSWWKAHGNYQSFQKELMAAKVFIEQQDQWQLASHIGVNIWDIAKAEFLCNALSQEGWYQSKVANNSDAVFQKAFLDPQDKARLLLCLAAAYDWLSFWDQYLSNHADITHVLVFSGSYVYTRSLMELAKQRNLRIFVLEHFFTGNDFYLEERSSPITNNSNIAAEKICDPELYSIDQSFIRSAYAYSRLRNKKNRNVPNHDSVFCPNWLTKSTTVFIIGQVVNDFSLIETSAKILSSISIYQQLIQETLEKTNANIIFKAHPWERKRAPIFGSITKNVIEQFVSSLSKAHQERIRIVEFEPIHELFKNSDVIVGICSQGLLEACQYGFKPVVIGSAFFSNQGFTREYVDVESFVRDLSVGNGWRLSLFEFQNYETFLKKLFLNHLIPNEYWATEIVKGHLENHQFSCSLDGIPEYLKCNKVSWKKITLDILDRPLPWVRDAITWLRLKILMCHNK